MREEIVIGLLRREDKVLLVKQTYGLRLWTLPGGTVEEGESLVDATTREFREETGLDVTVNGFSMMRNRTDQTCYVFTVEQLGGKLVESVPEEIEAVDWFGTDDIADKAEVIEDFTRQAFQQVFKNKAQFHRHTWISRDGREADIFG